MRREDIVRIIDGTHPTAGRVVAFAHQGLIVASGLAISLETVPGLPPGLLGVLTAFEVFVLVVFAAEYLLRLVCTPQPLRYALSIWGIVDLLSCLPLLAVINADWAAIRTLRLLRLVRLLKLLHANRALLRLESALHRSRGELLVTGFLGAIVLYIAGVGIYIFEHEAQPEVFSSVPKSLWWAIVSFTTVGYGDMYPITVGGRIFTAAVLFVGLGVIAVPTAIITSALINTDLKRSVEREIEEDLREEVAHEVEKDRGRIRRRPKHSHSPQKSHKD